MRKQYYEILDLLCAQLERRFDHPGMIHTAQIEAILLDSACGKRLASNDVMMSRSLLAYMIVILL
jgi:hypothetical protein